MADEPGYTSVAYITDHLGSVRVVVGADGTVIKHNEFLPYGELFNNNDPYLTNNDYLYGGKELQKKFGINLYDSQARFQANTGKFLSLDPLAEKYYGISPYSYCAGNPVNLVDPEGRYFGDYFNLAGAFIGTDGIDDNKKYLVLSSDEQKMIKKSNKKGETIPTSSVSSAVPVPSDKVVDTMEEAYGQTEQNGLEHGFSVGVNGTITSIVEGDEGTMSMSKTLEELREKQEYVAYDVHTHPKGTPESFGKAEPSPIDTENVIKSSGMPSVVLGYDWKTIPPPANTIGMPPTNKSVRMIGYYNQNGIIYKPIPFDTFKRAVNKINKR